MSCLNTLQKIYLTIIFGSLTAIGNVLKRFLTKYILGVQTLNIIYIA